MNRWRIIILFVIGMGVLGAVGLVANYFTHYGCLHGQLQEREGSADYSIRYS